MSNEPRCEECPFKKNQVFGEGSRIIGEQRIPMLSKKGEKIAERVIDLHDNEGQYDTVWVGMAPAREEVKEKRPFVGVSGQILRRTLRRFNIDNFYICNILLCPIEEDAAAQEAIKCCRDIIPEILARKPKLVIALGDMPLHYLADTDYSIQEVEGRVIPSKVGPLLPLTHPAYYLRNPERFPDFHEFLRPGIRFLSGNYHQAVEPTRETVTPETLDEVRNKLDKYDEIAVDTETTGFNAYGWEPSEILEMGLAVEHDHAYIVEPELIPAFKELLEEKKGIYWNAQFDCAFLKQVGINAYAYYDGMLAHYSMDERSYSHGLKRCAGIYLGCDDWEKEIHKYLPRGKKGKETSYAVIPKEVRREYLSKDVTRTLQLKSAMKDDINYKVFDRLLMPSCRMFIEIENRGMLINPTMIMNMVPVLEDEMWELEKKIHDLTDRWINPNSFPQCKELIYDQLGYPVDPFFGFSTGKEAMDPFRGDPIIDSILEYRAASKMKGTYFEGFAKFVDQDFRIHPNLNLFKAVTGRLSSDKPSIMNIKSDSKLKRMFLPDAGTVLLYGDIKGNELRWYYLISGDKDLGKVLLEGGDPHHVVSTAAYGAQRAKAMRTQAKAVVFGRMYQRTRASIERQVGSEGIDHLMKTVDNVFPGIKEYYKETMDQVRGTGQLVSYFDRVRHFLLLTPQNIKHVEREAVNFRIQSSGSDIMLLSMLHLWDIKKKWDIWPFWPVHDSITMNGPTSEILPEIKAELEEFCNDVVDHKVPFIWDTDWGIDWSFRKAKDPDEKVEILWKPYEEEEVQA